MKDRFKFRAWDPLNEHIVDFTRYGPKAQDFWMMATTHDWEVMQCTGLKDKNDKLIYEGDIVKLKDERIMQIGWLEDDAKFVCVHPEIENDFDSGNYELEIIGNVHENPELLKND